MGLSTERDLPREWDASGKNVAWKVALPGIAPQAKADQNQSSPIVWRDRVFVTTAFWPSGRSQKEPPDQHVACFAVADGRMLWDVLIPPGPWKLDDLRGGYCAPTPATDGERVYVLFGSAVLSALDFAGHIVWRRELPDPQSFDVAVAPSPILFHHQVLLLTDKNNRKSMLTAYDPADGHTLWERKRPDNVYAHSTPVIVEHEGRALLLAAAHEALQALDPATGEILWWSATPGDVASPVYDKGRIYLDSGRGGPGLLVVPTGRGELPKTDVKWRIGNIPEGLSSPVISGDYLYRLHNPGVLKCFKLADGKETYAKRLDGISVPSSPIATPDGILYFASAGHTFVVRAGKEFDLLANNDLGEQSSASAAVGNGHIFLKGREHLFCIGGKR